MHEERFWNSLTDAANVWKLLVVVVIVTLILFVVLRILTKTFADRRTRRILLEEMREADADSKGTAKGEQATK